MKLFNSFIIFLKGIKPCVAAFGGNQFTTDQSWYLERFFSLFYLSINAGSLISTILTPYLRNDVKCFGNDCFPIAFGIPAAVMFVAILLFIFGTPFYNRFDEKKDGNRGMKNIIIQTFYCIFYAMKNNITKRRKGIKKDHWIDYADDKFDISLIKDVKSFCRISVLFIPLPVFWALYDQLGSRWTAQAQQMDGRVAGITIQPDQFHAVNPIFILLLIPLFDYVVYPLLAKLNLLKKLIHRISFGLFLTVISFIIASVLESQLQKIDHRLNLNDQIKIINLTPCHLNISDNNGTDILKLSNYKYSQNNVESLPQQSIEYLRTNQIKNESSLTFNGACSNGASFKKQLITINLFDLPKTLIITWDPIGEVLKKTELPFNNKEKKVGESEVKFIAFNIKRNNVLRPFVENKIVTYGQSKFKPFNFTTSNVGNILEMENSVSTDRKNYSTISYAEYEIIVLNETGGSLLERKQLFQTSGRYSILLFENPENINELDYIPLVDIQPSPVHLFWQLIQIFVITCAEILVSISGLAFAYAEAPDRMKSVIQAVWLMTVAVGNLIDVIVAESHFIKSQVYEYLFFAALQFLATVLFIILGWFYLKQTKKLKKNAI
jgi:solute carrier family 15 (oligopeptide transporter), member 1